MKKGKLITIGGAIVVLACADISLWVLLQKGKSVFRLKK